MYLERMSSSPTLTETKPITGSDVAAHALTWVGTKWRHEGRSEYGLDCVGLAVVCAWFVGAPYVGYNYRGYARHPVKEVLIGEFRKQMIEVPTSKRRAGMVMIFDQQGGYAPYHVGILTSARLGGFVHAYLPAKKTISDRLGRLEFTREMTHCFAYKGVDY